MTGKGADPIKLETEAGASVADAPIFELLQAFEISEVVIVDDTYRLSAAENLTAALLSMKAADLQKVAGFEAIGKLGDVDQQRSRIRQTVRDMGAEDVWARLQALAPTGSPDDPPFMARLTALFGAAKVSTLSTSQWKSQQAALRAKTGPILFLFDLDQRNDGGGQDEGAKQAATLPENGPHYAVVISHHVPIQNEEAEYQRLRTAHTIKVPFGVASKSGIDLPLRLKHVVIRSQKTYVVQKMRSHVEAGLKTAWGKMDAMTAPEFEQIVFRASNYEGVWEPQTILRFVLGHTQRHLFAAGAQDADLVKATRRLRKAVRAVQSVVEETPLAPQAIEFDKMEMYIQDDQLKAGRAPISNGDIVEGKDAKGQARAFLVLTPPCDTILRATGNRGKDDKNIVAWLVPIGDKPEKNENYELPHFGTAGKPGYAALNQARIVAFDVLDLMAFHPEGSCEIDTAASDVIGLTSGQETRIVELRQRFAVGIEAVKRIGDWKDGAGKPVAVEPLVAPIRPLHPSFQPVIAGSRVSYDFKRTRRLEPLRAHSALIQLMNYKARMAFEGSLHEALEATKAPAKVAKPAGAP